VDDMDAVLDCWAAKRYKKALIFVDNAGSDVVLGGPHHPGRYLPAYSLA
jgi:hypothetical protein